MIPSCVDVRQEPRFWNFAFERLAKMMNIASLMGPSLHDDEHYLSSSLLSRCPRRSPDCRNSIDVRLKLKLVEGLCMSSITVEHLTQMMEPY